MRHVCDYLTQISVDVASMRVRVSQVSGRETKEKIHTRKWGKSGMVDWSRRTLLAGIGSTVALATAGCASSEDDKPDDETEESPEENSDPEKTPADDENENQEPVETGDEQDGEFGSLLAYLPQTSETDVPNVYASDVTAMNEVNEPFDSFASQYSLSYLKPHTDTVSKAVGINDNGGSTGAPLSVFEGEISPEGESETRQGAGGTEYEFYDRSDRAVAVLDGVSVVGESESVVESALAAKRGDETRYQDNQEVTALITDRFSDADLVLAAAPVENLSNVFNGLDKEDINHFAFAITVHGPDTLESKFEMAFADSELITDSRIETIENMATGVGPTSDGGTASVEDNRVTVRASVDLERARKAREIESPQLGMTRGLDLDSEYIEIEVRDGDQTPLDQLELRVNDETYDPDIWAQGQEKIGGGDKISIATEDVEPNTTVTLEHDHEYGSEASSMTILSRLNFGVSYDREQRVATLTYRDEVELDGDQLYVAVYQGGEYGIGEEKLSSSQPWAGETVTSGDQATIEDVDPGQAILVGWDGDTQEDRLYSDSISPPGSASFEYDHGSETLTVTLDLEEPRDATDYELRIEGETAASQWSDQGDTVEDGDTITVDGLSVRDEVSVVWTKTGAEVASHWISAPGEVAFEYDAESKELTATMELEAEQDASDYLIRINDSEAETQWTDEYSTLEDGDSITLSDIDIGDQVVVNWGDSGFPVDFYRVSPPGEFDFRFDPETNQLEIEIALDRPQDASKYEIQIDEESAPRQWTDQGDTVEDGDTITLENVERGAEIAVVWGEDKMVVGRTEAYPTAELSFSVDQEAGVLEITHNGGASFAASDLMAIVAKEESGPTEYEFSNHIDGEFTEGDSVEIETGPVPEESFVGVFIKDGQHIVDEIRVGEGDNSGSEDGSSEE
jgi:hypothetical protein